MGYSLLGSDRNVLLLILIIALVEAVLILHVAGIGYLPLVHFDYQVYNQLALNLIDHHTFSMDVSEPFRPTTFRPPGYPAFIAVVYLATTRSTMAVGIAQFICLALMAYMIYRIALYLTGRPEAVIAAAISVTYPALVFLAPVYFAEIPSALFVTLCILLLVRLQRIESGKATCVVLGVSLGIASLMRPSFVPLVAIIGAGILLSRGWSRIGRQLLPAFLVVLGFGLVVAPWIVRNRLLVGDWINLHTGAGWTLYVSAQQYKGEISNGMLRPEWDRVVDEFNRRAAPALIEATEEPGSAESILARQERARDRKYQLDAMAMLREIPASQYLKQIPKRVLMLWSTADSSPWATGWFHRFQQVLHVGLFLLAVFGCYLCRRTFYQDWPLWLVPAYLTLLHLVFHVEARYTVPSRQFVFVYSGVCLAALLRRLGMLDRAFSPLSEQAVLER
jgi:4-amino-4-deoxy-L-arabinose transferase-like glycosyltransferase